MLRSCAAFRWGCTTLVLCGRSIQGRGSARRREKPSFFYSETFPAPGSPAYPFPIVIKSRDILVISLSLTWTFDGCNTWNGWKCQIVGKQKQR
jgi:hypothetical protein